jgi:hypothetical protein
MPAFGKQLGVLKAIRCEATRAAFEPDVRKAKPGIARDAVLANWGQLLRLGRRVVCILHSCLGPRHT